MSDDEDDDKKQRVLHTRVSETLEQEVKDRAAALGMSVSNLVRNVLSNAVGLVEDVVADSASIARNARHQPAAPSQPTPAAATPTVLAWHTVVLNLNALCSACNAILPRGTDAALGITAHPGDAPTICLACLDELRHAPDAEPDC